MNRTEFDIGWAMLIEAWPHRKATDELADIYFTVLEPLTANAFHRAVKGHIALGTYFPLPAELHRIALPPASAAEAAAVFQRIEGMAKHHVVSGPFWDARQIVEELGPSAIEGFVAVGGSSGFAQLGVGNNRVFALQRFQEAFLAAAGTAATERLIGPAPQGEARALIAQVVGATSQRAMPDRRLRSGIP